MREGRSGAGRGGGADSFGPTGGGLRLGDGRGAPAREEARRGRAAPRHPKRAAGATLTHVNGDVRRVLLQ